MQHSGFWYDLCMYMAEIEFMQVKLLMTKLKVTELAGANKCLS